jgi:hypothetical protein
MAVINYALYIVIEFIKNPMVIDWNFSSNETIHLYMKLNIQFKNFDQ